MRSEDQELVDRQRRLASPGPRRVADRADDVAEMDVDGAAAILRAEQLDLAGAIDEIEEGELPVAAAPEHSPRDPPDARRLPAGVERLCLEPDRLDLVPFRKALGHAHRRASVLDRRSRPMTSQELDIDVIMMS